MCIFFFSLYFVAISILSSERDKVVVGQHCCVVVPVWTQSYAMPQQFWPFRLHLAAKGSCFTQSLLLAGADLGRRMGWALLSTLAWLIITPRVEYHGYTLCQDLASGWWLVRVTHQMTSTGHLRFAHTFSLAHLRFAHTLQYPCLLPWHSVQCKGDTDRPKPCAPQTSISPQSMKLCMTGFCSHMSHPY